MSKIRIFCEGETEQTLVKALSLLGKVEKKINLWERKLASKIRCYPANTYFIIIFDTDAITPQRIKCFNKNLALLNQYKYFYVLLQQTKNLEDELIYASNLKNQTALYKYFNAQGNSNLKTAIAQSSNLHQHITNIGLDLKKLWSRGIIPSLKHQSDPKKTCAAHLERKS